jgi:hypothetical protein
MKYSFNGWEQDPLTLLDDGKYGECLHATIQAYSVVNHPGITQAAIEDTGLLHELAHLASGVAINGHNSVDGLRVELIGVMALVDAKLTEEKT